MTSNLAWINGKWDTSANLFVPLCDRGLSLGDGIFETILIYKGKPMLLSNHLNRWQKGASILGMESPPAETWLSPLINEGIHLSSLNKRNGIVRLNWSRGNSSVRGISISSTVINHRFWLEIFPYKPSFNSISVMISKYEKRLASSRLNQCKTFNYGQNIQARREASLHGYDDALLLSSNGQLCCGTTSNLLIKRHGEWLTPDLKSGCLPGIMRQQGIQHGVIKEAKLSPDPKEQDEWLLINSLSCHPIKKVNKKLMKVSEKPKEFWLSLLDIKEDHIQ